MNNFGLADELFIRGNVPMTKSEIRALTLCKLNLSGDEIIWDIGAGTGSISIESALNLPQGQVFAIEKNPVAVKLIKANKEKFNCGNLQIILGCAPAVFKELPIPDKVFIGGSSGNLSEILQVLWSKSKLKQLVLNAITLNTVNSALDFFKDKQAKVEAIQASINKIKVLKGQQMLQAQNPIFIISAKRED